MGRGAGEKTEGGSGVKKPRLQKGDRLTAPDGRGYEIAYTPQIATPILATMFIPFGGAPTQRAGTPMPDFLIELLKQYDGFN